MDDLSPAAPESAAAPGPGVPLAEMPPPLRAQLEDSTRGTLVERMGMELVSLGPDGGVMTMPVAGNTQPAGLLHGGATIALAESVAPC